MGKGYKGKTCAYCGVPGSSEEPDHVLARGFFLDVEERRAGLPIVPACRPCNGDKGRLEHYLAQVLPFGGRHPDASLNLSTMVPKRLAKNRAFAATLCQGMSPIWVRDPSGLIRRTSKITIDSDRFERWCGLVARGLAYFHWGTVLGPDCFVEVMVPTHAGEGYLNYMLSHRGAKRVWPQDLGRGTFVYEGLQGVDHPQVSAWRLAVYGGLVLSGHNSAVRSRIVGVLTGPPRVRERAARRVKWMEGRGAL